MDKGINYIIHIPKTAGMSLQGLVRRRHKKPGELELVYDQQKLQQGFMDRPELRMVMGHFRFGYHRFSSRPARYHTFLRNPVEQVISHYRYTQDHPEKFEFLPEGIRSITDFARCPYGYNLQTRFVSGIDDIQGREREALEIAKDNLRNFAFTGITEEFDLSLLMLGKAMDWKILYYVKENTGRARRQHARPEEKVWAELHEVLQYDRELYAFGKALFNEQKRRHPELVRKQPAFTRANRLFQQFNPYYIRLKRLLGRIPEEN